MYTCICTFALMTLQYELIVYVSMNGYMYGCMDVNMCRVCIYDCIGCIITGEIEHICVHEYLQLCIYVVCKYVHLYVNLIQKWRHFASGVVVFFGRDLFRTAALQILRLFMLELFESLVQLSSQSSYCLCNT